VGKKMGYEVGQEEKIRKERGGGDYKWRANATEGSEGGSQTGHHTRIKLNGEMVGDKLLGRLEREGHAHGGTTKK